MGMKTNFDAHERSQMQHGEEFTEAERDFLLSLFMDDSCPVDFESPCALCTLVFLKSSLPEVQINVAVLQAHLQCLYTS